MTDHVERNDRADVGKGEGDPNSPHPNSPHPNSAQDPSASSAITDSPWFWAYVFGAAGLVALFLARPRYNDRQPQLERQFLARQEGGQAVVGTQGPIAPSTSEDMIIALWPLFGLLAALFVIAWLGLWRQRFRLRHSEPSRAANRETDTP